MTGRMTKLLCLLLVAAPSAGWGIGEWRAGRIDARMRHHLLEQATYVARTLKPQMVRELSFTEADKGTPAFEFIRRQMTGLGGYVSNRGIYTMALRDGQLIFGPESYPEDDPMASPPGTVYEESSPEDLEVFATGKPATFGPITDEYGTFVCSLAPVFDPDKGEILMAVGIDVPAEDWGATLGTARRESLLVSLVALAVLLAGIAVATSWIRNRRSGSIESADPPAWGRGTPQPGRYVGAGLLVGMGVLGVAFLGVVLLQTRHWTYRHIDATAEQQAKLAVELEKALRDYVGRHIRPEMEKRVAQGEFIPQAMSTSFVARSVFDKTRESFPDVIVRFPSTNPRNPANLASPSEASLIRYFEEHPEAETWSGVMDLLESGQQYFVSAIPRRFEAACLQCHGRPEDAPDSLIRQYGPVAGFGRAVGELSIDLAAVPVSASYLAARAQVWRHMLVALALCIVFLAGIAFLICADARRRRSIEATVEKERSFLRLVIDSLPEFVCVRSQDGRLMVVNAALATTCGANVQDLEGKCETPLFGDREQVERWRRIDQEVMAAKKTRVIAEDPVAWPDGAVHWFATTRVPLIDDDGHCDKLLLVASDITDTRAAQHKQQSLLQQVAGINEELTHFAYVVSHDLKAPLRGIKLIAEWLCADYADKLGAEGKEQLDLLQSRVGRMHDLIDGILQYSRVGRVKEETQAVDLNQLLPSVIDGLAAPEHIHITVESDLPVVEGEKTRISQVFQNLLSNAVKFMDKPVGEIRVGCVEDGRFWRFSVADNGPGIEDKHFDRIFKLFQTLAPRDEFESTGVGLALVKKIVEMYGGRIWVESKVGEGSTFLFTFVRNRRDVAPNSTTLPAVCLAGCGTDDTHNDDGRSLN
jgi:PAS domain S-box-containing protein